MYYEYTDVYKVIYLLIRKIDNYEKGDKNDRFFDIPVIIGKSLNW